MSKYPSGIEIPPAIKRIDSIPIRRSYEEVIAGLPEGRIKDMREQAQAEFERATSAYRERFNNLEEGIRYSIISIDWTRNLCQKQERK